MIDDTIAVVECNYKTNQMSGYLNAKSASQNLVYGLDKCFKIHIGRSRDRYKCGPICLDAWEETETMCPENGQELLRDNYTGQKD